MTKLICFDMDGVIFQDRNFWKRVHQAFNTLEQGLALEKKYLYTNYEKLVDEVVNKLWQGKPISLIKKEVKKVKYTKGAKETIKKLKKRGYKTAIITSSEKHLAQRAQKELNIDYIYFNELVVKNGKLTGEFKPHVRQNSKQLILKKLCQKHNIDFKDVIIVGDDKNDIKMAKMAGFAIAFNPKSEKLVKYCNLVIRESDLTKILKPIKKFEEEKPKWIS